MAVSLLVVKCVSEEIITQGQENKRDQEKGPENMERFSEYLTSNLF